MKSRTHIWTEPIIGGYVRIGQGIVILDMLEWQAWAKVLAHD